MNLGLKSGPQRVAYVILAAAIIYLWFPFVRAAIGAGASLAVTGLYLLAWILALLLIPFFLLWFFGFAYWFVKPYWRVWHIRHIRNMRLLKEAAERGKGEDVKSRKS